MHRLAVTSAIVLVACASGATLPPQRIRDSGASARDGGAPLPRDTGPPERGYDAGALTDGAAATARDSSPSAPACTGDAVVMCATPCGSIGTRRCMDGVLGPCMAPSETRCDGADEDCDGAVDEGIPERSCSTPCGDGVERCAGGEWTGCEWPTTARSRSCACPGGAANNFCHLSPGTAGCWMTQPGGYCDPNGDARYKDANWVCGYEEFLILCAR